MKMRIKSRLLKMSFRHRRISICDLPPSTTITVKERQTKLSIYDDATSKACIELLPVADSVTLALANLKDADPDIIKGIELISNQLAKSFEKLKIESYGKAGDAFDPNLHNAVSKIEDENLGADTIAAVYQTGYKIGDKIIRHAMVQVANCD